LRLRTRASRSRCVRSTFCTPNTVLEHPVRSWVPSRFRDSRSLAGPCSPAPRLRAHLPHARTRERGHRRARGPSMRARPGYRAFHDAQNASAKSSRGPRGVVFRRGLARNVLASGTPVASSVARRAPAFHGPRFAPKAAKIASTRRLVKGDALPRPGVSSIAKLGPGAPRMHRSAHACPEAPVDRASAHVNEDRSAPTDRPPFLTDGRTALARAAPAVIRLPFTRIRRSARAFDPFAADGTLL